MLQGLKQGQKYRVYVTYEPGINHEDIEMFLADSYIEVAEKVDSNRDICMLTIRPIYCISKYDEIREAVKKI